MCSKGEIERYTPRFPHPERELRVDVVHAGNSLKGEPAGGEKNSYVGEKTITSDNEGERKKSNSP